MPANQPVNPEIQLLRNRVEEMERELRDALERTSGLTWNNRNWEAVKLTLEAQEQTLRDFDTELKSVKNLVMTLQRDFIQFKQQRAIELDHFVGHGPTAPAPDED